MSRLNRINPLLAKILIIAALTLVLLIPLSKVEALIAERAALRDAGVERVANGVGHAQRIGAVMLTVPVTRSWFADDKQRTQTQNYRLLASAVEVSGSVTSESRRSGIYRVPAYKAVLHVAGSIADDPLMNVLGPEAGVTKQVGHPALFLAVSDPRGIRVLDGIRIDGTLMPVSAATVDGLQGVSADLMSIPTGGARRWSFAADLVISGTERLQFLPLAESTHVALTSPWPSPSFSGAFSPAAAPQVGSHGFSADWQVLQINRDYPQFWADDRVSGTQLQKSAFGVDFYQPVDTYQRDYRAVHYAVLFIALSYMALFVWEHLLGARIHAMQYAMTGAALSIFYLVLTAFSEHLDFAASYALAAAALTLELAIYFSGVLHSRRAAWVTGAVAGVCYSLLYLLVLSEDYALLFGALAIFFLLATIMLGTRKFDWYRATDSQTRGS
jgi:inner membrane protein